MLDAFKMRDVQTFIALLNTFEAAGISDVRFVRQRLSEHLRSTVQKMQQINKHGGERCPDCNTPLVRAATNDADCIVLACRKCRYSKLVSTATGVPCCGDKK